MKISVVVIVMILAAVPAYPQVWKVAINSQEEMNALQFYQERLKAFQEKCRTQGEFEKFWPNNGDTARFVLDPASPFATPSLIAYFQPVDNAVHLLADTHAVMTVLRTSMADPNERELGILFEGTVFVHELSLHWNRSNNSPSSERSAMRQRFEDAGRRQQLNDSLVVMFLLDGVTSEREAYLGALSFLRMHTARGEFSKENFERAVRSSAIGFYEQFHSPASPQGRFLGVLAANISKYQAQHARSAQEEQAIAGYGRIITLLTGTFHEMYHVR